MKKRISTEQNETNIRAVGQPPAHLLRCEAITAESIYPALLHDEPMLPEVHPERGLGRLLRLNMLSFEELLSYFRVRRNGLLRVLDSLTEKIWSLVVRQPKKTRKESVC